MMEWDLVIYEGVAKVSVNEVITAPMHILKLPFSSISNSLLFTMKEKEERMLHDDQLMMTIVMISSTHTDPISSPPPFI